MTTRGLWVDQGPYALRRPEWWDHVRTDGYTTLAVMADSPPIGLDERWTLDALAQVVGLARERDMEVVLTTWPDPREARIDDLVERAAKWCELGVAGVELDVEGQWRPTGRRYTTLATHLVTGLRAVLDPADVRLEVTTHPGHRECSARACIAPHADRLVIQAYSVRRIGDQVYDWTSTTRGPGRAQRHAIARAQRVPGVANGRPRLAVGLAAWEQNWPGHTAEEAMRVAELAALEVEPIELRWWSSKHIY